jgi:HAD superfamily hydrolase (TIGR01509 family)
MGVANFGVLFDMDGVIVHSNPAHKVAIVLFCKNHGKEVTEQFLQEKVYGRTNKEWIPEIFGQGLSDEALLAYADEKEAIFREIFKDQLVPVQGFIPFIDRLKVGGVKMAVATSAPSENADFILEGLAIKDRFEALLNSSHVDKGKPNPEVYLKAAAALGMPPERCIVVEDSLAGVKAGIGAGCKVVGVTTTHTAAELVGCALVVDDFDGLGVGEMAGLF